MDLDQNTDRFQDVMQWFEYSNHAFGIFFSEVEPGCLFKPFMPHFVPKDGDPEQLVAH